MKILLIKTSIWNFNNYKIKWAYFFKKMNNSWNINYRSQANSACQPSSLPCRKKVCFEIRANEPMSEITIKPLWLRQTQMLQAVNSVTNSVFVSHKPCFKTKTKAKMTFIRPWDPMGHQRPLRGLYFQLRLTPIVKCGHFCWLYNKT